MSGLFGLNICLSLFISFPENCQLETIKYLRDQGVKHTLCPFQQKHKILKGLLCLCAFEKKHRIQQMLPECQNMYLSFSIFWELSNAEVKQILLTPGRAKDSKLLPHGNCLLVKSG